MGHWRRHGKVEIRQRRPTTTFLFERVLMSDVTMSSDIEAALAAHRHELIESAATLYAVQDVFGKKVRDQSKAAFGRLVDAHLLIAGVLAAALLRTNGKITPITDTSEERDALFASYIIGMDACERAIMEGRYLQAHALLRQEMETLAQLKAVAAGNRNSKRSPNVAVLERSLARLYDELSAGAHVSKHHIVRAATEWEVSGDDLLGPTSGTRYFPAFVEGVARRSFALHLILTLCLIEELSIDLNARHTRDGFTPREAEAVDLAWVLMRAEGMVEFDD